MIIQLTGSFQGQGLSFSLEEGTFRVGRGRTSDIWLRDPSVSREHAELIVEGRRVTLRDLGSHNGSWVNDQRIEQPTSLSSGDRLRFGDQELSLVDPQGTMVQRAVTAASTDELLSKGDEIRPSLRLGPQSIEDSSAGLSAGQGQRLIQAVTEAGHLLIRHVTLAQLFDSVLELVDRAIPARRMALLLDEPGADLPQLRASRPPLAGGQRIMLSRTIIDAVIKGREALRVTDARMDERFRNQASIVAQNVHSALVAPLFDNEKVIGLLYADSADPRVIYDEDQLRVFTLLANLIAVKITNTRLHDAEQARELLERARATAVRIQQSLLPSSFPDVPCYEIAAHQTPCRWVGGDLYDVLSLPEGKLAVVLGDVSGKGLGAALLMSNVLASLRLLLEEDLPLHRVVERLNSQLLRSTEACDYLTLFIGLLDPREHTMEYVNAGHNPPMLVHPGGKVDELEATGPPVGLLNVPMRDTGRITMEESALLCIFSDGITEARREEEFFGEERLREALIRRHGVPMAEFTSGLLSDLQEFLAGEPLADDTTFLLLRRQPG
jgi:phosphoserine phosphatase RsbU/P